MPAEVKAIWHDKLPRSLQDLTADELLDRAFEPEFMRQRTPLEVELFWRLSAALHAIEPERASQRWMLAALWPEISARTGDAEGSR